MAVRSNVRQSLEEGNTDVTTSGTPIQVSSTDLWVTDFIATRKKSNSGSNIYFAFSAANANKASDNNQFIQTQDVYKITADLDRNMQQEFNLADIFIDSDVDGDGISYQYIRARGNG